MRRGDGGPTRVATRGTLARTRGGNERPPPGTLGVHVIRVELSRSGRGAPLYLGFKATGLRGSAQWTAVEGNFTPESGKRANSVWRLG
jgi:hypothetical protein